MQKTILILLCFLVVKTTSFQWNHSLTQVLHPTQECLQNPPVNVFYYPFLYTIDSPLQDYCGMNFTGCISLCENTILFNTKSSSDLDNMTGLINYCLYCNSSESMNFRRNLLEGNCESFKIEGKEENIGPKLYEIMEYHCGSSNIPLIDLSFVASDYFRKRIYTSIIENTTISWKTFISLYFSVYVGYFQGNTTISQTLSPPPLRIPVNCWCDFESPPQSQTFSYQCHDVNSNFLMYSYRVSPVIFTIVYFLLYVIHFIFLLIPKFTERIVKLQKSLSFEYEFKSPSFKTKYTFLHFLHISVHPPVLFSITLLLAFIENLVRVLSNYAFFYEYYLNYFVGIFRGLGGISGLCGYSSLVILWSHSIDLANTKKEQPIFLSRHNMVILGLVYIGVLITLITVFALYLSIDQNSAYIACSVATLIYTLSFVLGFLIYGFKMIHKLRTSNIWEYKFTKFIVFLSILSTIVWILCILIFITYSFGFDIFGTFFGNARNIILDLCLLAMTILSSYITINEEGFKKVYGERLYNLVTCSKSTSTSTSKMKMRTTMNTTNTNNNTNNTNTSTSETLQTSNKFVMTSFKNSSDYILKSSQSEETSSCKELQSITNDSEEE